MGLGGWVGFIEAFGKIIIPVFKKHGAKLIGAWQPSIGQNNEFVYILAFENLAQQESFWKAFHQDEEVAAYKKGGARVAYVTNKIIKPTPFSPLT